MQNTQILYDSLCIIDFLTVMPSDEFAFWFFFLEAFNLLVNLKQFSSILPQKRKTINYPEDPNAEIDSI